VLKRVLEDVLMRTLFVRSWFKQAELDALLCRIEAKRMNLLIKDVVSLRDIRVTSGSFHRSCKQGSSVLKKSVFSLVLASLLGIVDLSIFEQIGELVRTLQVVKGKNDKEAEKQAVALLVTYIEGSI
jgi:hypothetical protein